MIHVAIVDDEETERDRLSSLLLKYSEEKDIPFELTGYRNGILFLTDYPSHHFDLVFLDVDMPTMDGLATAKSLREMDSSVVLVFVTTLARYAIRGDAVDALDYLLKPLSYPAFSLKINKAIGLCLRNSRNRITVKTRNSMAVFPASSIIYVESEGHKITYHTEKGDFPSYGTMKEVEALLPGDSFFRLNSSYIVNLGFVSGCNGSSALLAQGGSVEISRARKKEFLEALQNYHFSAGGF